jgi:HSP90 family molecular chaperone
MKDVLGSALEKVTVSSRVVDAPSVIVTGQFGHTANMERIMRSQAMNDPERAKQMMAKKVMEINPRHPIIAQLAKLSKDDPEFAKDLAWLLFDVARLNSGFDIDSPTVFGSRVFRLMQQGLKLDSLNLLPEAALPAKPMAGGGAEAKDLDEL